MEQRRWIQFPELPFPLSTDAVLLADFCGPQGKRQLIDLGAGPGTLGLLLCASCPDCRVDGLELQEASAALAEEVAVRNGMADRVRVIPGDLRKIEQHFPASRCDAVLSNPPYFPAGSGARAASESLAIARTELCCTLSDVCRAAAYLLRWGAPFYLVHRPERLCDLITELRAHRLEPKRMRLVRHKPSAPPSLVLMESRLGGSPGLNIQQDLILHREDGSDTDEYRRIYGLEEP